jgi:hypothetical protein
MLTATIIVVAILAAFLTMPWWTPRAWYRALLYPGGRPNALSVRLNSLWAKFGALGGAPSFAVALETRGRRTGRTTRVGLVMVEVDGERYLVSMLGENVNWVRNVRASDGEAVLCHGITEPIRLHEVAVADRAPILQAYLRRAPGGRPHFDIGVDASREEFARAAARYPVFRIAPR